MNCYTLFYVTVLLLVHKLVKNPAYNKHYLVTIVYVSTGIPAAKQTVILTVIPTVILTVIPTVILSVIQTVILLNLTIYPFLQP